MADVKVSMPFLLELFGYAGTAMIQKLLSSGVLPQGDGRGNYPLVETVNRWALYMRQRPSAREEGHQQSDKKRHMAAKADIEELKAKALAGDLVPITQVSGTYERSFSAVRSRALSMPAKIAAKLGMCQNAVEAQRVVKDEVEEFLKDAEMVGVKLKGGKAKLIGQGRPRKAEAELEQEAEDA